MLRTTPIWTAEWKTEPWERNGRLKEKYFIPLP
jgi:hypothetical protein